MKSGRSDIENSFDINYVLILIECLCVTIMMIAAIKPRTNYISHHTQLIITTQ